MAEIEWEWEINSLNDKRHKDDVHNLPRAVRRVIDIVEGLTLADFCSLFPENCPVPENRNSNIRNNQCVARNFFEEG